MAKAFKLGVKLDVGHFNTNLLENLSYLLEYRIEGILFVKRKEFVEEGLIFLSFLRLLDLFIAFGYQLYSVKAALD